MKDIKKWRNKFDIYDKYRLAEYFETQAREGWILEDSPGSSFTFRRAEPMNLHYAIVYCSGMNDFESEPTIQQKTLYDFCACSGWNLVTRKGVFQVFCNAQRDPVPIETEPEIELENIHHGYKSATIALKICSLTGLMSILNSLTKVDTEVFNWFLIALWSILLLINLITECSYCRWHRKAKESVAEGLGIPPVKSNRLKRVSINILLCIAIVILTVGVFVSQTKMVGITMFVGTILLVVAALWFGKTLHEKTFASKHGNPSAARAANRKMVISLVVLVSVWVVVLILTAVLSIVETFRLVL